MSLSLLCKCVTICKKRGEQDEIEVKRESVRERKWRRGNQREGEEVGKEKRAAGGRRRRFCVEIQVTGMYFRYAI